MALSSLRLQYHALVFSGCIVMARCTQLLAVFCKYSRTLWSSGRSAGALYLNNIILYIDINIIEHIEYIITAKSIVRSRRYYESQNDCIGFSDVSGSSPSTSILPAIVSCQSTAASAPLPEQWTACSAEAAWRWCQRVVPTIPFSSISLFMYFRKSKQKFLPPLPSKPWLRYPPLRVSLWKYQRQPDVLCAITPTAERVYNTYYTQVSVCIHPHTHTRRSHGCSSLSHWRAKFTGRESQRKGR